MIDASGIVEDLRRRADLGTREVSFIELNRAQAHVGLLVFVDGGDEPFAYVKATADRSRAAALRREFANLKLLERRGTPELRKTVPAPLYCTELGDLVVLAESARPGTRMKDFPPDDYFASRRFRIHFDRAVGWLEAFAACLGQDETPRSATDAIAAYRATHKVSRALAALLDETERALGSATLRATPAHGDFCTANVVVSEQDELFVLDWEYPLDAGWPLADLLYFAGSTWCVPYRKGRNAVKDNYRQLFFETHHYSDLLRQLTLRYAAALSVPRDLLLPLSAIAWVGYANRKHRELASLPQGTEGHLPLILVEDDACLNLEILARNRASYRLG